MNKTITKKTANPKTDKTKEIFNKIFDYLKRLKNVDPQHILVIATIALVLIGWYQACTVKDSLEISNKAYLTISNLSKYELRSPKIKITLNNTGQTPAYDVVGYHSFRVVKNTANVPEPKIKDIAVSIGQNDSIPLNVGWHRSPGEATWGSISNSDSTLMFVGKYIYSNIFKERCVFEYCFIWVSNTWQSCDGRYYKNECN